MVVLLTIILSIYLLVRSADSFVSQASSLAKKLKIDEFLIGLTVVAFGTSLPELVSTTFSSISGHNQLVVSNIIGSNITNLCLILGLTAIFSKYQIKKRDVDVNIPLNIAAVSVFWALLVFGDFNFDWKIGIVAIMVFLGLIFLSKEYNHLEKVQGKYVRFNLFYLLISMVILIVSGKLCVDQIIALANQTGVSETILGYFLMAVGTSLPELVTTWSAVKSHNGELGIGSILGSNMFNLLFVLGLSSFIRPVNLNGYLFDLFFLTAATLLVFAFSIMGKKYMFSKKEGIGLLTVYVTFVIYQLSRY